MSGNKRPIADVNRVRPITAIVAAALAVSSHVAVARATLEEVIVTATKRVESLQDVPISMVSMSGKNISEMSVTRMEEFALNMPAVTIAQNPIGNYVFIRGLGTPGANQGMEQSVSIFHDGVYMGRHQLSRAPFMDLDRVEVLRGPQSILFGKNTIGGAIGVITAKPTQDVEGMVSGLYGSNDEIEVNGVLSGPITDNMAGRISFRHYETEGYLENTLTGKDDPEREDETVRGILTWNPADTVSVEVKYEHSQFEQQGVHTQIAVTNPLNAAAAQTNALNTLLAGGVEKYDDKRAVINDGGQTLGALVPSFAGLPGFPYKAEGSDNEMDLAHLNIEWLLGDHTLTSITAYASYDYQDICDCDFSALPLIQVDATEDYEQYSQELRLTSPGGEKFDYVAGLYFHKSDLDYHSVEGFGTNLLSPIFANVTRDYGMNQDTTMWAVFGSGTWSFTDSTRATLGLRYSEEDKEADHWLDKLFTAGWVFPTGTYGVSPEEYDRFEIENPGLAQVYDAVGWIGALGTFEHDIRDAERDEEHVSWSLSLEHDLGEDTMLYGLVSTGFKGGGFDGRFLKTSDSPSFEYEEEEALAFEIGSKMILLDGSMTLNLAAFYTVVDDYQVSIFDGATAFLVDNAAELESKGAEAELRWAATDYLTVGANLSYLKAEYKDWDNAPCTAAQTQAAEEAAGGVPNACSNPADPLSVGRDAAGEANVYSPEWAGNLNLDYRYPLAGELELRTMLNLNYSDGYFANGKLDPVTFTDSYTKVDLRLALGHSDGSWEVAFIGKNLTDEQTTALILDQPLVRGNYMAQSDRLRTYAVQATYRF
jgi:outer membrane receptor protein involved in Fe transport